MEEIEVRHLAIIEFQKRFKDLEKKLRNMSQAFENVKDLPKFVERMMPILTHF